MSKYDDYDDYDDEEYEDEEDLEDDDDSPPRSGAPSNPFSSGSRPGSGLPGGAGVRGAGINPPPRPAGSSPSGGSSGGITTPSPIRGGTPGGGSPPSGGSSPAPFQRPPLGGGSGSGGSGGSGNSPSGGSGGAGGFGQRPGGNTPFGGSGSGGSGGSSGSSQGGSGGSGGFGQRSGGNTSFGGSGSGGSGGSPSGGSGGSSGSGGSGQRPGASSPFGGDRRDDDKRDAPKPADKKPDDKAASGGGLGGALGSFGKNLPFGKKDDDKDAKPGEKKPEGAGGGIGGLGKNLPFGKKDDDKGAKPGEKKPDGSSGGLGGALGSFGKNLPFGKKEDDKGSAPKPAASSVSGAPPSSTSRPFGGSPAGSPGAPKPAEKKPEGAGGGIGGALGNLTSGLSGRLPFGGGSKDAPKGASAPARPGEKPATTAVGGSGSKAAFGSRGDAKDPKAANAPKGAKAAAAVPIGDQLRNRLKNLFNPQPDPKSAKARISKAPKVESGGLSLDTKLDILGVGLVLGSLAILLSSLSPSQGAVFGSVNSTLSYWFGWGALAVPVAMFGIGTFLILRHFGDEAPVIGAQRLIGIVMLYIGALAAMQYVNALDYPPGEGQSYAQYLTALRDVMLPLAAQFGRGGGRIGGELYYLLLSNFGEIGGFFIILGVLIVGIMFALKLSAAEIAIIIMSIGRSFGDSVGRRRQAAAVRRIEREEAAQQAALAAQAQSAAQPISVMRPPETLPAPKPGALPAPTMPLAEEQQRTIQLTMRGQTLTTTFNSPEGEGAPIPVTMPAPAQPAALAAPEKQGGGVLGRFGRGAAGTAAAAAASSAASGDGAQKGGGLFGRFGGGKTAPAANAAPVPAPATAGTAGTEKQGGGLFGRIGAGKPAAPPSTAPTPSQAAAVSPVPSTTVSLSGSAPAPAPMNAAPAPSPAAPPTPGPAPASPVPLGDLVRASTPPPAVAASTPAPAADQPFAPPKPATASGVQPFQRPPLSSPAPAPKADDAPAWRTPSVGAPEEKVGDEALIPGLTQPIVTARSPRAVSGDGITRPGHQDAPPAPAPAARGVFSGGAGGTFGAQSDDESPFPAPARPKLRKDWKMPDMAQLLMSGQDQELDHALLLRRAKIIEETLESFGAPGRVVEVRTGPVITQFGVEPDYINTRGKKSRVKVGAIAALDKDLQLALGAKSIRIEAPVPGKGYVGIEVPNEQSAVVRLRDVMESEQFKKINKPLAIALGQGVDGTPVSADLGGMPHLLIAGTTGSGKSVCVNSIIASLLIRNTPQTLKFIMVDPKRVELTQYNGIPHLVAPVVVELERIVSVLKWVTREMDERYRRFSAAGSRNIEDYNRHLRQGEEMMPYMVVIIDELADLMMLAPDETEKVITRIAALARATGIHLVIATQRPSVDVVTGLIKANFPARIAFAVAGGVDSRVILDQPGAERLLGRGDMLYMSGDSPAPVRLQGVFVSDSEINNITRAWRAQMTEEDLIAASRPLPASFVDDTRSSGESSGAAWNPLVTGRGTPGAPTTGRPQGSSMWDAEARDSAMAHSRRGHEDEEEEDGADAMYDQAVELVRTMKKASVSLLQRRLRIGYTRAARLIDLMEERGVVGPAKDGSSIPRDVIG